MNDVGSISGARPMDLVGRQPELAVLDSMAGRVISTGHHAVFVEGEAGIGKSALCRAFMKDLAGRGWLTLEGGCLRFASTPVPLVSLVAPARAALETLSATERAELPLDGLVGILPELERAGQSAGATDVASARMFDSFRALLSRVAEAQPVAMLLEDLHWADPATLDQVSWLVHSLKEMRVLIVCTVRTEYQAAPGFNEWAAEHRRLEWFDRLVLDGLDERGIEELADLINAERARAIDLGRVAASTRGNPYFVKEFLTAEPSADGGLPSTLVDSVAARLSSLGAPERELAEALAVLGGETDQVVLKAMRTAGRFEDAVRNLEAAGFVDFDGSMVTFRHALVSESLTGSMLETERITLHRRAAEAIESVSPGIGTLRTRVELANHWFLAREPQRSLDAALEAGRAAAAIGAATTAAELGVQAVESAGSLTGDKRLDPLTRASILIQAVEWLFAANDSAVAVAAIRSALVEGWALTLPSAKRARLLASMAAGEWLDGDPARAVELFDQAAALVEGDRSDDAAAVLYEVGRAHLRRADATGASGPARTALSIAEETGADAIVVDATTVLALSAGVSESIEVGVGLARRARRTAKSLGLVGRAAHTYVTESCIVVHQAGRSPAWRAVAEEGLAYARRHCGPQHQQAARVHLALGLVESGYFDDARPHLADLLELPLSQLNRLVMLQASALRAMRIGDFVSARMALDESHELAAHYETAGELGFDLRLRGEFARRTGDLDVARVELGRAIELQTGCENTAFLRESLWELVQVERAAAASQRQFGRSAAELRPLADRLTTDTPPDAIWRRVMDAELRLLEQPTAIGLGVERDELANQLDSCGYYFDAAEIRLRQVESMLELRPRPKADIELRLRRLHDGVKGLGAAPLEKAIVRLAGDLHLSLEPTGDAVERSRSQRPYGLTLREFEVFEALGRGLSNKDIAAELNISSRTASTHVSRILTKLGVKNRGHAAALYQRDAQPRLVEAG